VQFYIYLVLILSFPELYSVSEREIFSISLRKKSSSLRRLYKLNFCVLICCIWYKYTKMSTSTNSDF